MALRTSDAVWEGDLKNGKGRMKLGGGAFEGAYSFSSRFEEGKGTNPEELIGAAHAGCFSMALSGSLAAAGYMSRKINTTAKVHLDKAGEGFKITQIELISEGDVPGIQESVFLDIAEKARKNCPVSQALIGVEIKLDARLVGSGVKSGARS